MIVGTPWMIAISLAVNLGSVAVIVGRSPQARCNHWGHGLSFIAIRAADDCGSLQISWQSWCSSTRRVGVSCRGSISAAVPLRGLSDAGADLQLLRPGPNLLCRGVRS